MKISGVVIKGDGYGRKLGYPTVNLEVKEGQIPKQGVYCGYASLDKKSHRAGIIIGPLDKVEAHLIGYSADAYGKTVKLIIKDFLRDYQKFETEAELIKQIEKYLSKC